MRRLDRRRSSSHGKLRPLSLRKSASNFRICLNTPPDMSTISPMLSCLRRPISHPRAVVSKTQTRNASLLRRPKRPYTFTQLITLSDGSTFVHRTTSPLPIYRSTKDARNAPLWNPSSQKLLNVEEDEAGRLRAFRAKFGRGWDAEAVESGEEVCLLLVPAFGGEKEVTSGNMRSRGGERETGCMKHADFAPV